MSGGGGGGEADEILGQIVHDLGLTRMPDVNKVGRNPVA